MSRKKIFLINFLFIFLFISLMEVLAGYLLNRKKISGSSLIHSITILKKNSVDEDIPKNADPIYSEKLLRVLELRKSGDNKVFPFYIFDSQVHPINTKFWFSHPPNSKVVYCNEGSGLLEFDTNNLGFRKTINQDLSSPLDLILLGDSYIEGACVKDPNDVASKLATLTNKNILNLSRGGAGPLYQYSLLKELNQFKNQGKIKFAEGGQILWVIFTGNDMANFVEEKSTNLTNYLSDGYSQNYFSELDKISEEMRIFFYELLKNPEQNVNISNHNYGETILKGGGISLKNAIPDIMQVAKKMKELSLSMNLDLNILLLHNHPWYSKKLMNSTHSAFIKSCEELILDCKTYSLKNKSNKRSHLNEEEYKKLSRNIYSFIKK